MLLGESRYTPADTPSVRSRGLDQEHDSSLRARSWKSSLHFRSRSINAYLRHACIARRTLSSPGPTPPRASRLRTFYRTAQGVGGTRRRSMAASSFWPQWFRVNSFHLYLSRNPTPRNLFAARGVLTRIFHHGSKKVAILFRFGCHCCHAGVLKPALDGYREYFHSQTIGDADRLEGRAALNFIQHRG